jgi:hypothetical protein
MNKGNYMLSKKEIQNYERFFRDPEIGKDLLKPAVASVACNNIRIALNLLGYDVHRGNHYDEQLAAAVRQFQIDHHHSSHDGFVGPGTRHLLSQVVAQKLGKRAFAHMEDPEEHLRKKLHAPLRKDIERKNELIEAYKEHLHILELQAAKFGTLMAPPHLQTGIKETKELIENLQKEIAEIKKKIES